VFSTYHSRNQIFSNMSTTTTLMGRTAPTMAPPQNDRMTMDGKDRKYGDWRDDLASTGYAVVKGAIPRERADKYADAMYSWLEGL